MYGPHEPLCEHPPLLDALRILHVERNAFLRRQSNRERTLRTVDARVHHRVEPELDTETLRELLHVPDLVLIDRQRDGFDLQRQAAIVQEMDAPHASVERPWDAGQPLVGFARVAIERYLDGERPLVREAVRDTLVDENSVGEQGAEKATSLRVPVDIEKIAPRENLTTCV